MKKTFLYFIILALYLLTFVCVWGILGTAVSKKFEVDESYWRIDGNEKLSDQEKKLKIEELDKKGIKLENRINLFIIGSITCFVLATGLLVKGKSLMKVMKSGT